MGVRTNRPVDNMDFGDIYKEWETIFMNLLNMGGCPDKIGTILRRGSATDPSKAKYNLVFMRRLEARAEELIAEHEAECRKNNTYPFGNENTEPYTT